MASNLKLSAYYMTDNCQYLGVFSIFKERKMKYLALLASSLLLFGCGTNLPDCGDAETVKLLKNLVANQIGESITKKSLIDQVVVVDIETEKKEEKPLRNLCKATLAWRLTPSAMEIINNLNSIDVFNPNDPTALMLNPEKVMRSLDPKNANQDAMAKLWPVVVGSVVLTVNDEARSKQVINAMISETHSTLGSIGSMKMALERLTENYPYPLEDDVVYLSNKKVDYIVRLSEDKATKGDTVVAANIRPIAINLIREIESLSFVAEVGAKFIRNNPPKSPTSKAEVSNVSSASTASTASTASPASPISTPAIPEVSLSKLLSEQQEFSDQTKTTRQNAGESQVSSPPPVASSPSDATLTKPVSQQQPHSDLPKVGTAIEATLDHPKKNVNSDFAPSFDCAKVSIGPERLICDNRELALADVQLVNTYKLAQKASDPTALKLSQREWLKTRNACADVQCIKEKYKSRQSALDEILVQTKPK